MPAPSASSWFLLWPPLAVSVAAVAHVLVARASRSRSQWGHLLVGVAMGGIFLWGAMAFDILTRRAPSDIVAAFALNTLTYLGLVFLYADFNNMALTSLRMRVLRECGASREGLTMNQLSVRYDETSLITARLDKYVRHQFLIQAGNTYRIGKPTILWMCRCYQLMHWIVFGHRMTIPPDPAVPERDGRP